MDTDEGHAGWAAALADLLARSHALQADGVVDAVNAALQRVATTGTVYLVDPEQRALVPLLSGAGAAGRPGTGGEPIEGSFAGRTFMTGRAAAAPGDDVPRRLWCPVVDGTERLGVMAFALPPHLAPDDPEVVRQCLLFAGLVGHLLASKRSYGDHLHRVRRRRPMSTAAELLWQLLPPLTFSCDRLTVSAVLEPCYEVGGDGFDYAVDGATAHIMVLDAAGHGLRAGLACAVALAAVRAARRGGGDLHAQTRAADEMLLEQFDDVRFVTAVLGELHLDTGRLRYINAGHPAPLLMRGGHHVGELGGGRRMPLGFDDARPEVGEVLLRPQDQLLMYTDGITEARSADGEMFGTARLIDLFERQFTDVLPTPEILRRLCHAVIDHQTGPLRDDATLLLLDWSHAAADRNIP